MTNAEDLADKSVDDLKGDVKSDPGDVKLAKDLAGERLKRVKQANRLRECFFWIAIGLAGATVITSIVLVVAVLNGVALQSSVAVAFISGLAVETIGILAVIAGYLFPREKQGEADS